MKRTRESGAGLIIVVIVLVVALFTSLGFVFYQNFVAKKPAASSPSQSSSKTTATTRIAFQSTIYALDYPQNWLYQTSSAPGVISDGIQAVFTNHDQTIQAAFTVSDKPVDVICDPGDGLKVTYYAVHQTAATKLGDQPLSIVEAIYDHAGGGYSYAIGLTQDGGATHAAVGDSHCNITAVGVASTLAMNGTIVAKPAITAVITFPKLVQGGGSVREMQLVKDLLVTNDYKAAVKILESARKE